VLVSGENRVDELRDSDIDDLALRVFLMTIFQALEDVSARNRAYRKVVQKEPNGEELAARVTQTEQTNRTLLDTEKYSDLRDRAIESVLNHSLSELAALAPLVKSRVQIWGKA
jgi:hypothetical protein